MKMNEMTNSHILIHQFDYYEPATLDEAVALLARHNGAARVLAGGTDLLVHMKMERTAPQAVVNIGRIPGLDRIAAQEDGLHIGGRATVLAIERVCRSGFPPIDAPGIVNEKPAVDGKPAVMRENPPLPPYHALAEACANFSTTQVQTMGTIGGNLGNGSPASDTAPALIALAAEVELTGLAGIRRLPVEHFFLGPGKTALGRAEIISDVIVPWSRPGAGSAFQKISRVAADIAKASAAAALMREGDRVAACRLAFGSVAPTPIRAPRAEQTLIGQSWSEELALRAAAVAAEEIAPIDDVRSTAQYRRDVARALAFDALTAAWGRTKQASSTERSEYPGPQIAATVTLSGLTASGTPRRDTSEESQRCARDASLDSRRNATRGIDPLSMTSSDGAPASARFFPATDRRMIQLQINGRRHAVWVAPNDLLLNVLREQLQLTGTKYGCGIGECSACTVLLDGAPTLACLVLAVAAVGHDIVTIEGLAQPDGELDPLQDAFIEYAAYQCGYCTPGMILTAKALLADKPQPSEDDVRHYLRGNLCRCTGYASIVRAVLAAAEKAEG
jgi:carbon-monoxide dehydrogenase medium subunit